MPVVAGVAAVVGVGMSVAGAVGSKKAGDQQAAAARELGEENAQVLERQAEQGKKVMGFELGQFGRQANKFSGSQAAAMGSGGITSGGSASLIKSTSATNLKRDRTNLYDTYQNKIDELYNQAELTRKTANLQGEVLKAQGNANMWSNIGSAVGGVGTAVSQFGQIETGQGSDGWFSYS